MIQIENSSSLTDFQSNATEYVERLKKTGSPEILTVNGNAELVIQDAQAYQQLLDKAEQLAAIEGIKKGLSDIEDGRVHSAKEVHQALRDA